MKYKLLGAVSTIALGAAFGMGTPGAANAALICSGTTTNGSCTETRHLSATNQDFTNISIPVDYFRQWRDGRDPGGGTPWRRQLLSSGGNITVSMEP